MMDISKWFNEAMKEGFKAIASKYRMRVVSTFYRPVDTKILPPMYTIIFTVDKKNAKSMDEEIKLTVYLFEDGKLRAEHELPGIEDIGHKGLHKDVVAYMKEHGHMK